MRDLKIDSDLIQSTILSLLDVANSQAQSRSSAQQSTNPRATSQNTNTALAIATTPAPTNSGPCHLRELDLCAASLLVFMQAPGGLATSEQEVNKQCTHIKEANQCFDNYTRRCMTPMQRQVATLASNTTIQLAKDYCTNSQFRTQYLKHANCLNQVQKKEQKGCMQDAQAGLELIANGLGVNKNNNHNAGGQSIAQMGAGKRIALACCTFKRFENCFGIQLDKKCGKETVNFVQATFRTVTSRLPETMCRLYKHDSNECRAILPKSGTVPKGSKSNSIISRLMTAYSACRPFKRSMNRVQQD